MYTSIALCVARSRSLSENQHFSDCLHRLRDESPQVRMNTMKIMTRLILNDMVKVKGQISEMATCLEDRDPRIAELAKSFFSELSKKVRTVSCCCPNLSSWYCLFP